MPRRGFRLPKFGKRRQAQTYAFFVGLPPPPRRKTPKLLLLLVFLGLFFPAASVGLLYYWVAEDISSTDIILTHRPSLSTFVYDAKGRRIGTFAAERRRLLPLSRISPHVLRAIVSVEDERFYRHWGVDPFGILRAAVHNFRAGGISQGGSTLTQQLVRLLLLGRERTLRRKVIEAFTAIKLEFTLSKKEILERYLNLVYFGRGAYGIAAAARTYFDKEASDLTVTEAALLAGLVQAPGRYRPFTDPGPSLERRAHVLRRMAQAGYLTREEEARLAKSPLGLRMPTRIRKAGHFLEYVRRRLEERYGSNRLYRGGLRVRTTIDVRQQDAAEAAIRRGVARLIKRRWPKRPAEPGWRPPEAALFALDPRSGAIRAMVGGVDFEKSKFNRTVQALRQPGSAFKPIVYAAAIDRGFTPVDSLLDAPIVLSGGRGRPTWKPQNYAKNFQGRLSLREALSESRNTVSVRLVREIGLKRVIEFARRLGIRSPISPVLSSALGSSVLTLKELVSAYSVFADGGVYRAPYAIERVEDPEGNELERHVSQPVRAIRPEVAYVITYLLRGVVENGTARGARVLNRPVAGKTGTTNEFRDNWFVGYSPGLVAGVWLGFDLPRPLGYAETGGRNAVPIFVDFFRESLKNEPVEDFVPPPGVEFVRIDTETGLLATGRSKKTIFEAFLRGTGPTNYSGSPLVRRPGGVFRADASGKAVESSASR